MPQGSNVTTGAGGWLGVKGGALRPGGRACEPDAGRAASEAGVRGDDATPAAATTAARTGRTGSRCVPRIASRPAEGCDGGVTGAGAATGDGRLGAQAGGAKEGLAAPATDVSGFARSAAPAQASAPRRTMKPQFRQTRSAPVFAPHDGQMLESTMIPPTVAPRRPRRARQPPPLPTQSAMPLV